MNPYFTDLDGMRGVLAVVVMLFHTGLNPLIAAVTRSVLPGGLWTLCVDFFFVLSGFVLYFSMERTRPGLRRYFNKRLRRLAPVFLIATIVALLAAPYHVTPLVIAANLAMVQSPLGLPSIDHPAWSIPFELFLPALALPVLDTLGRLRMRTALLGGAVALVAATLMVMLLAFGHDLPLGRAFCGLTLGMLLGRVRQHVRPSVERSSLVLALFSAAILIMLLALRFPVIAALFPLVSAVCIFFGTQTRTILSAAPFQAIGRWSYSIYLLHIPVLLVVGATIGSVDRNAKLKALVIVVTIAAAAALFRFVERPVMKGRAVPAQTAP